MSIPHFSLRRNWPWARFLLSKIFLLALLFDAGAASPLRGRGAVRNPVASSPAPQGVFAASRKLTPPSLSSPWLGGTSQSPAASTHTTGGTISLGTNLGSGTQTLSGTLNLTGSVTAGTVPGVGVINAIDLFTPGSSNLIVSGSSSSSTSLIPALSYSGIMVNQGLRQVTLDQANSATFANTASLLRVGSGSLTLSGNNTYTGSATLDPGILTFAGNVTLSNPAAGGNVVFSGGLTIQNNPLIINSSTPRTLNIGGSTPVTLTAPITASGGTVAFPALGASASLSFAGNGTFALTGLTQSEFDNLIATGRLTLNNTVATSNSDGSITLTPSGSANASFTVSPETNSSTATSIVTSGTLVVNNSALVSGSVGSIPSLSETGSAPAVSTSASWTVDISNPQSLSESTSNLIGSLESGTSPFAIFPIQQASNQLSGGSAFLLSYDDNSNFSLNVVEPIAPPDLSGVPEPSSFLALAGLALLGLGFRRRR